MYFSFIDREKISRLLPVTIAITLLITLLIIVITPPATGYEISIYDKYPTALWVLFSINIFLSIFSILWSPEEKSTNRSLGYISVLLMQALILFFPMIRGYYAFNRGSGDIFYHLQLFYTILNSGYVPQTDTYPMMHILPSMMQLINIEPMTLFFLISIFFFIMYCIYFFNLGKTITKTKKGGLIFSVVALPLLFSFSHYSYYPFLFALYFFPLELLILHKLNTTKRNRSAYYVSLVLLSLFITYCHPLVAIINFIMFSIFAIIRLIQNGKEGFHRSNNVAVNIAAITFVTFSLWYLQHTRLHTTSQKVWLNVFGGINADTILSSQMEVVSTSDASLWLIAERLLKIYGPIFLYISISGIFIFYLIASYYRYRKVYPDDTIYSIHFIAAMCFGALLVFENLVIFELIRAASYGLFFSTILCGLCFYKLLGSKIDNIVAKDNIIIIIALIISTVSILSVLSLFPSPWIGAVNPAFTFAEKQGTDWIIDNKYNPIPILTDDLANKKYIDYHNEVVQKNDQQQFVTYSKLIPSNFGYNETWSISKSFAGLDERTMYMVTTDLMKMTPYAVPVERRDRVKWFKDSDFIRLKQDPSVDLIYSNIGYEVWFIS